MYLKTNKAKDDTGDGAFVINGASFSVICKSTKTIGYLLRAEVYWGYLLAEFMGGCYVEARRVHCGTVRESSKVEDEVIESLELWCIWGSNISWYMVDIVHKTRKGILNNV